MLPLRCASSCGAVCCSTHATSRSQIPLIGTSQSHSCCRAPSFADVCDREISRARPPSCSRPGPPTWAWWYTVHRSIDGVHREVLDGQQRWRWCCYTSFCLCSRGLEPVGGIDMISIAHLASHLLTPGSRVADLNGEMACLVRAAVMLFLTRGWLSIPSIAPTMPSMPATPRDPQKP